MILVLIRYITHHLSKAFAHKSRHTAFIHSSPQTTLLEKKIITFPCFYTRLVTRPSFPPTMSFNASFTGSSNDLTPSQLYASLNVDYTQINWFERQWMAWYLWIGNPVIATGIASFLLHEVCLPAFVWRTVLIPYVDRLFRSLRTMDHH